MTLVGIPMYIGILLVYSILIYFIAQLQQTAGQFLYVCNFRLFRETFLAWFSIFFLFLSILSITMQAWFRAVAAAFKSEATAQSVAGASFSIYISSWAQTACVGIFLLALVIYTYV
jgi:ATP-binding cassette subfamily G (WHITE) protein 2 (SNQ2)